MSGGFLKIPAFGLPVWINNSTLDVSSGFGRDNRLVRHARMQCELQWSEMDQTGCRFDPENSVPRANRTDPPAWMPTNVVVECAEALKVKLASHEFPTRCWSPTVRQDTVFHLLRSFRHRVIVPQDLTRKRP